MLYEIPNLLNPPQLQVITALLAKAKFVDGKLNVGYRAKRIKSNIEMDRSSPQINQLNEIILGALSQNPIYNEAAFPHELGVPMYARYTPGMYFGQHVDNPINEKRRLDIAITVFLNDPNSYEGGELSISTNFGAQKVKLPAGHAVMYPASSLHQVEEVTSGERLVAVTGVQSMIRDPLKRDMLYELGKAYKKLSHNSPDEEETAQVNYVLFNLIRRWSEV